MKKIRYRIGLWLCQWDITTGLGLSLFSLHEIENFDSIVMPLIEEEL
jgi:hypothetical protein